MSGKIGLGRHFWHTINQNILVRFQQTLASLEQWSRLNHRATFEPVWAILADAVTGARLQLTLIHQNQVPKKQLVQTCQAGHSTFRELANTW
jgi:hypothetical protein